MAWLTGGLSQFTDQISTFTKEVLTETTEEVEDPAAELQVTKRKINELESLNKHIQSEWEKLKAHNDELTERAETAEYQISTISKEYRNLIQERDEELRRLKVDNATLKEQRKGLNNDEAQSPLKELAKGNFFENKDLSLANGLDSVNIEMSEDLRDQSRLFGEEFHDFGDVISSQSEINRLQSELAKLKMECQHLKTSALEKGISDTEIEGSESNILLLRNHIEELQKSLKREMEQHQRELTALQSVHAEQLHTLSQRHQNEIDQLQYQIDQSQKVPSPDSQQSSSDFGTQLDDEVHVLRLKVAELEKTQADYMLTKEQCEKLTLESSKLAAANAQLTSQLERENLMTSKLHDELETLKDHFSHEKESQLQQLVLEKQTLASRLSEMEDSIKEQEMQISKLQSEYDRSQGEVEQLNNQVDKLSLNAREKEAEVVSLKGALSSGGVEKEKTNMELSRVLLELQEVKHSKSEKENEIAKLCELLHVKDREVNSLKEEIETRKVAEESLSAKCTHLDSLFLQGREQLEQKQVELDTLKKTLQPSVLKEELTKTKTNLVSELQKTFLDRGSIEERDGTSSELVETLRQTELKLAEMTSTNEELSGVVNVLKSQVNSLRTTKEQLEAKLQTVEALSHSLQKELQDKLESKQLEYVKCSKQLSQLKAHLIEVGEQHTQETLQADERERNHKLQIADLQKTIEGINEKENTKSQHQLETLRKQLLIVEEQRDDALLQMSNAQEQAEQNAAALSNLENVLEQFQRDQSSELASALKRTQSELADALEKCKTYREAQEELKTQLADASSAAETATLLNIELETKENEILKLHKEMEALHASFTERLEQQNDVMDKSLVKNLVLGYIHTTDHKKPEVLQLIGKILEFSSEELEEARGAATGNTGWLSGFWKRSTTSTSDKGDSLSQVFVKFLESESLPNKLKPHPLQSPSTDTATSGYIDPRSDPDRPSLATATVLGTSTIHPSKTPPTGHLYSGSNISPIPKVGSLHFGSQSFSQTSQVGNKSTQSSLLKNVLSE